VPVEEPRPDSFLALNPIGRFFRHNAMHAGRIQMVLDEFGRCARCVKLGFWNPDAYSGAVALHRGTFESFS